MKKAKEMIDSAFSPSDARQMLEWWRISGNVTESQYIKLKKYIKQSFS